MEKLRVCFVIGQLGKGGAERQLVELVRGLDWKIFKPTVVSLSEGGYWAGTLRDMGIQVIELRRTKNHEAARLVALFKVLRRIRPRIVHTFMFSANTYGRLAAMLAGVPVVVASERSLPVRGKDKTNVEILIDSVLSFFSSAVICNSDAAAATLRKRLFFRKKAIFVVHNGIEADTYSSPGAMRRRKGSVIGTVGNLYPVKNHELFLRIAKALSEKMGEEDLQFVIVGGGPLMSALEEMARGLGILSQVTFTGERNDVHQVLQEMDIFVMTSRYEGLSNAIMEAMATGLPVVAGDVGGNRELVEDGMTGYLCSPTDVFGFSEKIATLLRNKVQAKTMGKRGRDRIKGQFSVAVMVKKIEAIYGGRFPQEYLSGEGDGQFVRKVSSGGELR